jgi:hypothetical protein
MGHKIVGRDSCGLWAQIKPFLTKKDYKIKIFVRFICIHAKKVVILQRFSKKRVLETQTNDIKQK